MNIFNFDLSEEQKAVVDAIGDLDEGFFIDIGANNGRRGVSQVLKTLVFKKDWKGIAIEADPNTFQELQLTYAGEDRVRLINKAISDKVGKVQFLSEKSRTASPWSTMCQYYADHIVSDKRNSASYDVIEIESDLIMNIWALYGMPKTDILAIDAEGMDDTILRTINYTVFKPKYIMAEINKADARETIPKFMADQPYEQIFITSNNAMWRRK